MTTPAAGSSPTTRTGVILAAGFGSRLRDADPDALKPLTPVAGRPLLVGAIEGLRRAGCGRVVVVLGFAAAEIEAGVREAAPDLGDIVFVENPRYELANGVSVLAAAPHIAGAFVLTMADHVFDDACYAVARDTTPVDGGAVLLIDRDVDGVFDLDDATKVLTDGDRIAAIGKQISDYDAIDTGLFVCTRGLLDALQTTLDERGDTSLSDGVATLCATGRMHVRDIGAGRWQDVDTPEMLAEARRVFGE